MTLSNILITELIRLMGPIASDGEGSFSGFSNMRRIAIYCPCSWDVA